MKTIEERANAIYDLPKGMPLGVKATIAKEAYIKGAIDQKQLDDEEYRKDMRYINTKKQELIDKACELLNIMFSNEPFDTTEKQREIIVNAFRKALA